MIHSASLDYLAKSRILITGGTGSLGQKLTRLILDGAPAATIIIYSRDEFKQFEMEEKFAADLKRLRFFLGDVRDRERLKRAMESVDHVIHAAALKQVPAAEYNPFEFVKTNIIGAQNVIDAALDVRVKRVVALSHRQGGQPDQPLRRDQALLRQAVRRRQQLRRQHGTRFSRRALRQRRRQPRQRHPVLPRQARSRRPADHRPADDAVLDHARAGRRRSC